MSAVGGEGGMSPELRATYARQFAHSVDLFQRSLAEYNKADEFHKRAEFKKVMDEMLNVMQETARACLSKEGQIQKHQLEEDYHHLIPNPDHTLAANDFQKLVQDVNHLKQALG